VNIKMNIKVAYDNRFDRMVTSTGNAGFAKECHKEISMRTVILIPVALVTLFIFSACRQQETPTEKEPKVTGEDVRKESKQALETTGEYLRQKKEEYRVKAEEELNDLKKKVAELQTEVKESGAGAREKLGRELEELKKKEQTAREKLNELEETSAEKWEEFKSDMDAALQDLQESYRKAVSHFKE